MCTSFGGATDKVSQPGNMEMSLSFGPLAPAGGWADALNRRKQSVVNCLKSPS